MIVSAQHHDVVVLWRDVEINRRKFSSFGRGNQLSSEKDRRNWKGVAEMATAACRCSGRRADANGAAALTVGASRVQHHVVLRPSQSDAANLIVRSGNRCSKRNAMIDWRLTCM